MKYEIRTQCSDLRVREATKNEDGIVSESRTICGKAIAFDSPSEILYDEESDKFFREIIKPEACTAEFLATQDVKLNMLHEREQTIARSNKGVGNLKIDVREDGVYFEFDAPKCDLGERCLQLVREGVYTGCSFEFIEGDYNKGTYREGTAVLPLITHTRLRAVGALTIGMDPAYSATNVLAREAEKIDLNDEFDEDKDENYVDNDEENDEENKKECNNEGKKTRERILKEMQRDIEILEAENY